MSLDEACLQCYTDGAIDMRLLGTANTENYCSDCVVFSATKT